MLHMLLTSSYSESPCGLPLFSDSALTSKSKTDALPL